MKVCLRKLESTHWQNRLKQTEFCAFYAWTHALEVYFAHKLKKSVRINPLQIVVKSFFHIGFRVFNRGMGLNRIGEMLKKRLIQARVNGEAFNLKVKGYRVSHYTHENVKDKIRKGIPVVTTIGRGRHALVIVGYDDDTFNYCVIDSNFKNGYRQVHYTRFDIGQTIYTIK